VVVNQYPTNLTTLEGKKRGPSISIEGFEGGVLWLGVHQWMSSVLGPEKDTPMSWAFAGMREKNPCRRRMLPL